ncbi:MAG: cell wall-binding repeat-containing protein, partial [Firmicutes bacterium]|nr:cell wall-binding repeat-containing protein [Bacillota bacterium]
LKSVGKKDIYIIGGDAAVSGDLDAVLAEYDNDGTVERVWGDDRALTAVAVAEQFFGDELDYGNVVFAYGGNFPDCIAGGLLAASLDAPILYGGAHQTYTDAGKPFIDKWNIRTAYVLGGPTLISDEFVRNMA